MCVRVRGTLWIRSRGFQIPWQFHCVSNTTINLSSVVRKYTYYVDTDCYSSIMLVGKYVQSLSGRYYTVAS